MSESDREARVSESGYCVCYECELDRARNKLNAAIETLDKAKVARTEMFTRTARPSIAELMLVGSDGIRAEAAVKTAQEAYEKANAAYQARPRDAGAAPAPGEGVFPNKPTKTLEELLDKLFGTGPGKVDIKQPEPVDAVSTESETMLDKNCDIGEVMDHLKEGGAARRPMWRDGQTLFLLQSEPASDGTEYDPSLAITMPGTKRVIPLQLIAADMLAEDWILL